MLPSSKRRVWGRRDAHSTSRTCPPPPGPPACPTFSQGAPSSPRHPALGTSSCPEGYPSPHGGTDRFRPRGPSGSWKPGHLRQSTVHEPGRWAAKSSDTPHPPHTGPGPRPPTPGPPDLHLGAGPRAGPTRLLLGGVAGPPRGPAGGTGLGVTPSAFRERCREAAAARICLAPCPDLFLSPFTRNPTN